MTDLQPRDTIEVAVDLPAGHAAIGLATVRDELWALIERPDGGSYWINVSNAIEPTEH